MVNASNEREVLKSTVSELGWVERFAIGSSEARFLLHGAPFLQTWSALKKLRCLLEDMSVENLSHESAVKFDTGRQTFLHT